MADHILRHDEFRGIHKLTMDHGANALDRPLMKALRTEFRQLSEAGSPAVILASAHPSVFCPGWNLKLLAHAEREEVADFLSLFNGLVYDLFSYQGPSAAAIAGHSVAAGCLLAVCCDLRVMASGPSRQGLSELNLGVPVPWSSLQMLRARLSSPAVDELVFRGEGCTAERARELGIVHRVASRDDVITQTEIETGKLAGRPRRAFVEAKRMLLGEYWRAMKAPVAEEDAAFLDCWFEEATQDRIKGVATRLGQG